MNTEGKIAIVGGIPGVGKTTVINKALKLAEEESFEITTLVYGSIMMEVAKEKFNVTHRDHLRKLSAADQKTIQRMAGGRIAELSIGKTVIVDTHYTIKIGLGSYLQGVPSWVSDSLNPKLLVLIETTAEEVTRRRSIDSSRKRDKDAIELLDEHQNLNRTVASTICQKTGALLAIIKNRQGKADEAGKDLFEKLKAM